MHRELRTIARELLTAVPAVERFRTLGRNPVDDSLRLLGGLAELARESIAPAPPVAPALAAQAQPVRQTSVPAHAQSQLQPKPHSRPEARAYGTQRGEYRPALRDPSIVDALLALNRVTPTRAQPGPGRSPSGDFAAIEVPLVDASPKPIPPGTRHSPGRVLR